ncbi:MAG: 50S ribosomal protein L5 [Candidatus Eremiobacteraeota bacterium]|nr:50S ribosomal protein L5 [Candidatus Eremiobacteraeota bacterium]
MFRLKEKYKNEVLPKLVEQFNYSNVMEVPRLEKVVVSMGVGEAIVNSKNLDYAVKDLMAITGQRPVITKAKKSVAAYKLRKGMKIGCKVTLRGKLMYAFLDKLFNVVLPRIRDFRGLPAKSFDGRGNYALGLKEQIIFPEIDYDSVDKVRGMNVVVVTTAKTDEECLHFLKRMGCPIRKN